MELKKLGSSISEKQFPLSTIDTLQTSVIPTSIASCSITENLNSACRGLGGRGGGGGTWCRKIIKFKFTAIYTLQGKRFESQPCYLQLASLQWCN